MLLIGDIHGRWTDYAKLIEKSNSSVQLGDFGIGFRQRDQHGLWLSDLMKKMEEHNARFFRGNHDKLEECISLPQFIPDGTIENQTMYVGGAFSIDWMYRLPGHSWWDDEELSVPEFDVLIQKYLDEKPTIMLTHDCPSSVIPWIHNHNNILPPSRTGVAFQTMFEEHQPDLWIFGHHHKSFDMKLDDTRFICLNELETFIL